MATATVEYDLNNSDDSMAFTRTVKSLDMALVLWEFTTNTKKSLQHNENLDQETVDILFNRMYDLLEKHSINLDELVQ